MTFNTSYLPHVFKMSRGRAKSYAKFCEASCNSQLPFWTEKVFKVIQLSKPSLYNAETNNQDLPAFHCPMKHCLIMTCHQWPSEIRDGLQMIWNPVCSWSLGQWAAAALPCCSRYSLAVFWYLSSHLNFPDPLQMEGAKTTVIIEMSLQLTHKKMRLFTGK